MFANISTINSFGKLHAATIDKMRDSPYLADVRRAGIKLIYAARFAAHGGKTAFAAAVKRSPAQIGHWFSGHRNPNGDTCREIERHLGLPRDWLDNPHSTGEANLLDPAPIPLTDNPDYPAVRRVRLRLSAGVSGFGVEPLEGDDAPIVFRREWFASRGYRPGKLLALRVAGNSMQPGLWEGDTVIINTADTAPRDGAVYALNYEGEAVIKRLVHNEGRWWLRSDNPDQGRHPPKACGERVLLLGRVVHKQSEQV